MKIKIKENTTIETYHCMKGIKVVVMFIFFSVFLIGTISAVEWDNTKTFNKTDRSLIVHNFWNLPLVGSDIAKITPLTPHVVSVFRGVNRTVAEFQIENYADDYSNVFKKMEFYNLKNNNASEDRQFFFQYESIVGIEEKAIYEKVCENLKTLNGTNYESCSDVFLRNETVNITEWKDLDISNSLSKGTYKIRIITDVKPNEKIEFIPTWFGVRMPEYSIWTEDLNTDLFSYFKLEELSGAVIDSTGNQNGTAAGVTRGAEGIIDNAYFVVAANDPHIDVPLSSALSSFTINYWIKSNGTVDIFAGGWTADLSGAFTTALRRDVDERFIFQVSGGGIVFSQAGYDILDGNWHMLTGIYNTTHLELFVDGNSNGTATQSGTINVNNYELFRSENSFGRNWGGEMDEIGFWLNRSLTSAQVTQLYNDGLAITWTDEFAPTITLNSPVEAFNSTNQTIDFNGTVVSTNPTDISNVSLILDGSYNQTNSSGINNTDYLFTLTLPDGDYNWTYESCNTNNECINATTRNFTIDTILPTIDLIFPTGQIDSHAIGDPLNLNWTVDDVNLDVCWFDYNNVNTTVTCLDNSTTFNTVEGIQNLTFRANDTLGNENSVSTSWTYAFLETGLDFNFNVSETDNQSFEINVTTDITVLSISALLTYNGTNHTSIASCTGGNCTISNIIDIPLVTSGEFENKSFFWNLAIFNGTESTSIVTSTRQQNVSRIHLQQCGGSFTTQTLNFTAYDEQTLVPLSPFSFDGFFEFWLGGGTIKRNNSIAQNDTEITLCLSPNETMRVDAIIDYDDSSTNYTNRFFYFDEKEINNVSEDILMYLLLSSSSTSFILKVQDESLLPVSDALIEIHRFYPGTGEFRIVQIARTDDSGKSIGFFETETVDYKFIIKKDGVTLLETGQQKVVPEVSPFTLTFNTGDPLGAPWAGQENISGLNSTLVFNDTSGFVNYVYIDSSGNLTLARLLVVKESLVNSTNNTIVCNETSTLTSATLTCNVGSTNGFYVASSFITRDTGENLDKQFTFQIETLSGVVGLLGLFYGWFLVLIASFMFKFNEIAGIWAITVTIFLINLTGLINFGGVFVTGVISVAVILTWLMER